MSTFELLLEYADKYTILLAQHTKMRKNMAQKVEELTDEYARRIDENKA